MHPSGACYRDYLRHGDQKSSTDATQKVIQRLREDYPLSDEGDAEM